MKSETVKNLHERIIDGENADDALWQAVIAWQKEPLCTCSGLQFSYTVKHNKYGGYSGEMIVSRKEGSKTLTKSSVLLAFHKVLEKMEIVDADEKDRIGRMLNPPEYKGPKAIGQIFGISYVYSLFWKLGLIKVPQKIEDKLLGEKAGKQ